MWKFGYIVYCVVLYGNKMYEKDMYRVFFLNVNFEIKYVIRWGFFIFFY